MDTQADCANAGPNGCFGKRLRAFPLVIALCKYAGSVCVRVLVFSLFTPPMRLFACFRGLAIAIKIATYAGEIYTTILAHVPMYVH